MDYDKLLFRARYVGWKPKVIILWPVTDVSEEPFEPFFTILAQISRHLVPSKRWQLPTNMHDVTPQTTVSNTPNRLKHQIWHMLLLFQKM